VFAAGKPPQTSIVLAVKARYRFGDAGKTTLTFSVSVNVLSAKFSFCMVPAGGEGGGNRKYVDVSGKR
jgi:hypothetical protein